jgi:hypothetical protein
MLKLYTVPCLCHKSSLDVVNVFQPFHGYLMSQLVNEWARLAFVILHITKNSGGSRWQKGE